MTCPSDLRPFVANNENEACRDASLVLYFSSLKTDTNTQVPMTRRSKTCPLDLIFPLILSCQDLIIQSWKSWLIS